mmetsp:Transcript_27284/g.38307  ORF Transcript_27284/g.38307 Transcript_27284/m.38307 type:complete len:93 (-) Transcript_27284:238-516(-)
MEESGEGATTNEAIRTKGTKNHRAPELAKSDSNVTTAANPRAADCYSLGILLFGLKTGGVPYVEDEEIEGFDLQKMLYDGDDFFWEIHSMFQ